jgi:membrane protease YdiL (CAAX protease family)
MPTKVGVRVDVTTLVPPRGGGEGGVMTTTSTSSPPPPVPDPVPGAADPVGPVDAAAAERPFGARLRLAWWKPLLLIPGLLVTMVVLQTALVFVVTLLEVLLGGRDPESFAISPAMMAVMNLSLAASGVLAVLVTALVARVPWRSLIALPRGPRMRRLGLWCGAFTALVGVALGLSMLISPDAGGMGAFAVSSTTVGLVIVALLTTPLQAAGEELLFRGAVMPLLASWIRAVRPALVLGMIGSSVLFGLAHFSVDPWLLAYYVIFGLSMAAMALISRGLEAPIAFHVMNNLIMMIVGALFAGGEGVVVDRSVGMGGPYMLVFIAVDLVAVALVWLYERRQRS